MPDFERKSRIAYNKKADNYTDSREGQFTRGFQRLLLYEMKWDEHQNVLDVACGNGSLLTAMNEMKPICGYGIDIAQRMIDNATADNPAMEFHVSGCDSMPFGDGVMDIITVCAAYHHFPDTAAFAQESKRVMKPNGRVYIAEIYLPLPLRLILNPFVPLSSEGDVRFYSPREICMNFKQYGFEREIVKTSGHIQIVAMKKTECD